MSDDDDDDEQWEEDFFTMFLDDDDEDTAIIYGTYEYATHLDKHYNRSTYRVPKMTGLEWVELKLSNETFCYNMFRMTLAMFYRLHNLLTERYGLKTHESPPLLRL